MFWEMKTRKQQKEEKEQCTIQKSIRIKSTNNKKQMCNNKKNNMRSKKEKRKQTQNNVAEDDTVQWKKIYRLCSFNRRKS